MSDEECWANDVKEDEAVDAYYTFLEKEAANKALVEYLLFLACF